MTRHIFSSVTRISDLESSGFQVAPLDRQQWEMGDYVVGELIEASGYRTIELPNGRMMDVTEGDRIVGAFGSRAATLEAVGYWHAIDGDTFEALTPAGLFGKATSISPFSDTLMSLRYTGHVVRNDEKQTMKGSLRPVPSIPLKAPVVLITGTSMSSGKTLSGRLIVHLLAHRGLKVVGAKLTGAARYRDVLSYKDAGAIEVFDFVDGGLPSTVTDESDFRVSLDYLLNLIAALKPDVVVAEAGASPLEPYNGKTAIDVLGDSVKFNLLCASDPYAVIGVANAFDRAPDLVAGGAANTTAAIELVEKLTGLKAMNLISKASHETLEHLLVEKLGIG